MFGSFANVCIFRLPKDQSIWWPRSHCPHCNKLIQWYQNIPLLSFIALRGRCSSCKTQISWQYPFTEALMAGLFLFSAWYYSFNPLQALLVDVAIFYFVTISIIDYHHKIIPDELSLSMIGLGLLVSSWNPFLWSSGYYKLLEAFLCGLVGGAVMLFFAWAGEKFFKKEALGGGDIKLIAGIGTLLGMGGVLGALSIGSFIGAAIGLGLLALKRKKPGDAIPYGPFLCLGAFLSSLMPEWWHFFLFP